MHKIILVLIGACVLGLVWYGWLFYIPKDARKSDGANVFVTFSGTPTQCEIRMDGSAAWRALPCANVLSYFREDLKLAAGATFFVSDLGIHGPEIASVNSALEAAGYRSVGSRRIAFITEPERPANSR